VAVAIAICPIQRLLHALHERFAPRLDGKVATYIPELSRADPRWFGISPGRLHLRQLEGGSRPSPRPRLPRRKIRGEMGSDQLAAMKGRATARVLRLIRQLESEGLL
jgi:hypothetical protein